MSVRIGILTGGGDCPGLNAVIRAVARAAIQTHGGRVFGVRKGWSGLISGEVQELLLHTVSGILPKGGTILGTSRTNPYKVDGGVARIRENFKAFSLDALVAVGGEDTLGVADKLHRQEGLPVVGVPKTIDNDLCATDFTFGFDTAVNIATDAIDRLHTTAESHNRVIVVEVMGRHAGWIAVYAGMAGGADVVLIPEVPVNLDEVCELIRQRHKKGKDFSIVVVAEGAKFLEGPGKGSDLVVQDTKLDSFGHVRLGGVGAVLAQAIEDRTGFETRYSVLGHIQRGGTPTAFDRVLATRFGVAAVNLVLRREFGRMVSLQGNRIVSVPLEDGVAGQKTVDMDLYDMAKIFFG